MSTSKISRKIILQVFFSSSFSPNLQKEAGFPFIRLASFPQKLLLKPRLTAFMFSLEASFSFSRSNYLVYVCFLLTMSLREVRAWSELAKETGLNLILRLLISFMVTTRRRLVVEMLSCIIYSKQSRWNRSDQNLRGCGIYYNPERMYENLEKLEAPSPTKCASLIRVINLSTGALITAFGLVGIIYMAIQHLFSLRFFLILSPIFMIIFGVALIAIEVRSPIILENFGFLRTLMGRGIFNLYLSAEVYYYFSCGSANTALGWISAMVLFSLGLLYLGLQYCAGAGYSQNLKEQLS